MDGKKISFGFSKIVPKKQLESTLARTITPQVEDKIEIIECLEGQTIKIAGHVDEPEAAPLVIALQTNSTPLEKVKELKKSIAAKKQKTSDVNVPDNETLDQKAAREILNDLVEAEEQENEQQKMTVSLTADDIPLGGAESSSIQDYEDVPIQQFGLAMLRGMGWKDEEHKVKEKKIEDEIIVCRPKGLGLGADKAIKKQVAAAVLASNGSAEQQKLIMKKGAFVKIIAGKLKDYYGQVEGMDEDSGRTFVKFALSDKRESINEAFIQLVTEKEYKENRKVINLSKYDEFMNKQISQGNSSLAKLPIRREKRQERRSKDDRYDGRRERRDRDRERHDEGRRRGDGDTSNRYSDDQHTDRDHYRRKAEKEEYSHKQKRAGDYDRDRHGRRPSNHQRNH